MATIEIKFTRATLPREGAEYVVGKKIKVDEASAARWVRRGAAEVIEASKPAKADKDKE